MSALQTDTARPKAAGILALAIAHHNRGLHAKPADYVVKSNPHVADRHAALTQAQAQPTLPPALAAAMKMGGASATSPTAEDRRAAAGVYANATLAEQERLGVPEPGRQVLTETMAQDIVTGLVASDPAKADQTLRDLAQEWGDNWPRVWPT